ncbi:hypothetical protein QA612_13935 [Evansella sp. AB-P1]|uniref:hypothetical protein n=1 Tax=Evansella sp. AB-P1 TaxID=3037653 RepID=UPI00241CE2C6|nr:hypothetical protein [Evansella sp. AB-P1]MDG5788582.1 hypothetical protein [Evansella sp. AB-P1]
MIQLSKKQYYILLLCLFVAIVFGYIKHLESNSQREYLNPLLMEKMHTIRNEVHTTSSILNTVITENEIPYAQWIQLKNGVEMIEDNIYEMEKMARAFYPYRAKELQNATKVTAHLILNQLKYIEDNFLESDLYRLDRISFSSEPYGLLEPIYETIYSWNVVTNEYHVTTDIIKHTYWVDMMIELVKSSIKYQNNYLVE